MSDLGRPGRRLFDLARRDLSPSDDARARVRAKLMARVGVTAGLAGTISAALSSTTEAAAMGQTTVATGSGLAGAATSAASAGAKSALASGAAELGVAGAAAGGSGLAVAAKVMAPLFLAVAAAWTVPSALDNAPTGESDRTALNVPSSRTARAQSSATAVVAQPSDSGRIVREVRRSADAPLENEPAPSKALKPWNVAPTGTAASPVRAVAPRALGSVAPQRSHVDTRLLDELSLAREMEAALARGEHARVAELARIHARSHPTGTLVEERVGAETIAACRQGGSDRPGLLSAFVSRYPQSPMRARVEAACKVSAEPKK